MVKLSPKQDLSDVGELSNEIIESLLLTQSNQIVQ